MGVELCAEVGDGLTGRRRRIVGVFAHPLLQQRSDTLTAHLAELDFAKTLHPLHENNSGRAEKRCFGNSEPHEHTGQ